ncbi:putative alcohol dehydrogenase [Xylariales sp. PMI_506]|nr:putative alcohol dehydrogenase [Xylariales sp. PMI_506]
MASTQKALLVQEIAKPVVLVHDRPILEPETNQILVKVSVAGINPHDAKARNTGLFIKESLPAVLANDVVGTVAKLGAGVDSYAIGDRVVVHANIDGVYSQAGLQEYALGDVFATAKIPDSITDDEAATLPTNIIAPLVALFSALEIPAPWTPEAKSFDYAGTSLLVVGGGSSCGKFGVQLAKLAGIGKIVVVGGPEAELKEYGATHVVDRHGGDDAVLARIRDALGNDADELVYAYDAINVPADQVLALQALSSHKRGALARLIRGDVDETKVVGKKAGFDLRNVFGLTHVHRALAEPFWQRVPGYLEQGVIKPLGFVVKEGLTAENVNELLDAYRDEKKVTKTHIHIV